jgi:hypothetical protein
VLRKGTLSQKCKILSNAGCLEKEFTQGMNDYCRKLGDCGLEANIAGEYTSNYQIRKAPRLSSSWIAGLTALADKTDNYVPFINLDPLKSYLQQEESSDLLLGGGGNSGDGSAGGVMTAIYALAAVAAVAYGVALAVGGSALGALGGFLGIGVGTYSGAIGAALGSTAATPALGAVAAAAGAVLIVVVVVIIIIVILMLLMPSCPPIEVEFKCSPWQPPVGGANCDLCNDELESCTKYRCESLGAACGLINPGCC